MVKPDLLTRINGVLLIAACLFAAGVVSSAFAIKWIFVWMGVVPLLAAVCLLAWLQYRALARGDLPRVRALLSLLTVYVCPAAVASAFAAVSVLQNPENAGQALADFAIPWLVTLWGLVTLALTWRWRQQLIASAAAQTPGPAEPPAIAGEPNSSHTGSRVLMAVGALAIVAAGYSVGGRDTPPESLMHGSAENSRLPLPPGATDVCLLRPGGHARIYNFATDEAGFWQWAESMGGSRQPHDDLPAVLPIGEPVTILAPTGDPVRPFEDHVIHRGWFYHRSDGRRGLDYAYDADEGRAYFANHPD